MFRNPEVDAVELVAVTAPQPGDCWHEMYSYWLIVLAVEPDKVLVWEGSGPGQIPEIGQLRVYTRAGFRASMTYASMPDRTNMILNERKPLLAAWLLEIYASLAGR
jgi:hypothetical protein